MASGGLVLPMQSAEGEHLALVGCEPVTVSVPPVFLDPVILRAAHTRHEPRLTMPRNTPQPRLALLTRGLAYANFPFMAQMLPFYIREDDPPAKRQILRAAMKLFSEQGFAGTSIRDIARESGYTNPALYKHFAGKEELALYLFEICHRRLWTKCHAAIDAANSFDEKLEGYIGQVLELVDEHPDAMAFLSDSARVLWPKAGPAVRRQTMIGLARSLMSLAPRPRRADQPSTPTSSRRACREHSPSWPACSRSE